MHVLSPALANKVSQTRSGPMPLLPWELRLQSDEKLMMFEALYSHNKSQTPQVPSTADCSISGVQSMDQSLLNMMQELERMTSTRSPYRTPKKRDRPLDVLDSLQHQLQMMSLDDKHRPLELQDPNQEARRIRRRVVLNTPLVYSKPVSSDLPFPRPVQSENMTEPPPLPPRLQTQIQSYPFASLARTPIGTKNCLTLSRPISNGLTVNCSITAPQPRRNFNVVDVLASLDRKVTSPPRSSPSLGEFIHQNPPQLHRETQQTAYDPTLLARQLTLLSRKSLNLKFSLEGSTHKRKAVSKYVSRLDPALHPSYSPSSIKSLKVNKLTPIKVLIKSYQLKSRDTALSKLITETVGWSIFIVWLLIFVWLCERL